MPTLLITGSRGNIGASLVAEAQRQHPDWQLIEVRHRHTPDEPEVAGTVWTGDLRDDGFVRRLIEGTRPTHIIHAAAPTYNAQDAAKRPFETFADDVAASLPLIRHWNTGTTFIYLSSATVYERCSTGPFVETMTDDCPAPVSPVGKAKAVVEAAMKARAKEQNAPYTIWRLFNIVSPREPHDRPGAHVFVDFFRTLFVEHAPTLQIFGSGAQARCFTWVEDAAEAILRFADDARSVNETFNLGGNEPITLLQLKDLFLELGKKNGWLPADYMPDVQTGGAVAAIHAVDRLPSLAHVKKILDWTPTTDVRTCFELFLNEKQKTT